MCGLFSVWSLLQKEIIISNKTHFWIIPSTLTNCTTIRWDAGLSRVDVVLPRPAVQHQAAVEFSLFFKDAAPSWVVRAMCWPTVCVNMCLSERAYVRGGPCLVVCAFCEYILPMWQSGFFTQNCTSHGFPFHVINRDCNLQGR